MDFKVLSHLQPLADEPRRTQDLIVRGCHPFRMSIILTLMSGPTTLPPFDQGFTLLAFTCVRAPAESIASFFETGIRRDYPGLWKFERGPLALPFPEPKPGGRHFPEIAIWRPCCHLDRCVITANLQDGFCRFLAHYLSTVPVEFTTIRATAPSEDSAVFEFSHHENGSRRQSRCVQALRDDPKWQFYQEGVPLPFEDTQMYSARRVRDRLTAESIVSYLTSLGYEAGNPAFWRSDEDAFYARQLAWSRVSHSVRTRR